MCEGSLGEASARRGARRNDPLRGGGRAPTDLEIKKRSLGPTIATIREELCCRFEHGSDDR